MDRGQLDRVRFKWERFSKIYEELRPLFKKHWQEVAIDQDTVPLDPDWNYYFGVDQANLLYILTARSEFNGKLAGYIFNIIGSHNHYKSTRFANTEMFYLHPRFRRGWQPVKFFKENLRGLEMQGVEVAVIYFKLGFKDARVGKLLARLGYVPTDIVMRKRL
ncbi:MAG TPA: hypothetical protein VF748_14980 [Candidatus Acidoferrum sp.]